MFHVCVSSAAAKKAASSHSESSGEKDLKEGINGEMEEETNGKAKEGQEVASGSKSRVCQRQEANEASGQGELTMHTLRTMIIIILWEQFYCVIN